MYKSVFATGLRTTGHGVLLDSGINIFEVHNQD